jgi:hypothetical protein
VDEDLWNSTVCSVFGKIIDNLRVMNIVHVDRAIIVFRFVEVVLPTGQGAFSK